MPLASPFYVGVGLPFPSVTYPNRHDKLPVLPELPIPHLSAATYDASLENLCCVSLPSSSITSRVTGSAMPTETRIVSPGPNSTSVRDAQGQVLQVPKGWELLPPGDAGLTRRVKSAGPTWTVKEKRGRRMFSRGVWAPADRIATIKADLDAERSTESYAKRRQSDAKRREKKQAAYVEDFHGAVVQFLNFHDAHHELADRFANAVTAHATPVGSGTVARTQRIPVERRAESAVIAWMRHQTTAYDNIKIPRVRGKRRETRRLLADQSRQLLEQYRRGASVDFTGCPLWKVLGGQSNELGSSPKTK